MHVGCINENNGQNWIPGYFKIHDYVCKHVIQLCISLKLLPTARRIGLLRHAYQQHVGLR